MSDQVKQAWSELVEQVNALGVSVKDRVRGADGETDADALRSALDHLRAAGRELSSRLDALAHDESLRDQARATSASLDSAVGATVDYITEHVEALLRPGQRTAPGGGDADHHDRDSVTG